MNRTRFCKPALSSNSFQSVPDLTRRSRVAALPQRQGHAVHVWYLFVRPAFLTYLLVAGTIHGSEFSLKTEGFRVRHSMQLCTTQAKVNYWMFGHTVVNRFESASTWFDPATPRLLFIRDGASRTWIRI